MNMEQARIIIRDRIIELRKEVQQLIELEAAGKRAIGEYKRFTEKQLVYNEYLYRFVFKKDLPI